MISNLVRVWASVEGIGAGVLCDGALESCLGYCCGRSLVLSLRALQLRLSEVTENITIVTVLERGIFLSFILKYFL
jgi:hypothetical protein